MIRCKSDNLNHIYHLKCQFMDLLLFERSCLMDISTVSSFRSQSPAVAGCIASNSPLLVEQREEKCYSLYLNIPQQLHVLMEGTFVR